MLEHPLGADRNRKASADYGVLLEEEGIATRGTFIIDPEGVVRFSLVNDLDVGRNVDEILRVLKALQSGGLCGASWQAGDSHLG